MKGRKQDFKVNKKFKLRNGKLIKWLIKPLIVLFIYI